MIHRRIKYIWFFLIGTFLLSGCSDVSNIKNPNSLELSENMELSENIELSQLEKDMDFLTSDQCEGRRAGTLGNELAGEYIAERFEILGLQPLEQDYKIPYTNKTVNLVSNEIILEILDEDITIDEFEYGSDFIEVFLNNADFSLPLVLSPIDTDCVMLTEDDSKSLELSKNPYVKLIIKKNEKLVRGGDFYHAGRTSQIKVLPEVYSKLLKYAGKNVRFKTEIEEKNTAKGNIAGAIEGEDSSKVLLISAHFDHVGKIGDMIWRGALDNASGVCALLRTAQVLAEYYKDSKPPYDIVFCAFNSEETLSSGDGGSIYFSSFLNEKYHAILNINLDCIGNKDNDILLLQYNDSKASKSLGNIISEALQKADIKSQLIKSGEYISDHQSFHDALCISTIKDVATSNIHTVDDTQEMIDMEYLETVGYQLGECIFNRIGDLEFSTEDNSRDQAGSNQANSKIVMAKDLTVKEFEEAYHCKLDFIDSDSIIIHVASSNRSILSEQPNEKQITDQKDMTLWDVRSLSFMLKSLDSIHFATYDKSNSYEVMAYEADAKQNGFAKENLTYLLRDGEADYYITNEESNSNRVICMIAENDFFLVHVTVSLQVSSDASLEDYKKYFQDNINTEYINGMVKLLLDEGGKQDE